MSDAQDGAAGLGHLAIRSARIEPLRKRMRSFVFDHEDHESLSTLRERTDSGVALSEHVDRGRNERFE